MSFENHIQSKHLSNISQVKKGIDRNSSNCVSKNDSNMKLNTPLVHKKSRSPKDLNLNDATDSQILRFEQQATEDLKGESITYNVTNM